MRAITALLPLLFAGGCLFDGADFGGTSFLCDESEPCPPGFDCVSGQCVAGDGDGDGGLPDAPVGGPDAAADGAIDVPDGGAGPDGAAPDACIPGGEPTIQLFDDFEDGVTAGFWNAFSDGGTSVSETGGQLVATPQSTPQPRFAGYRTSSAYDLTEDRAFVDVPAMVNVSTQAQARFLAAANPQNAIYLIQQNGTLRFGVTVGGADTDLGTASYDPVAHRFWQIREAGGTVFGEVSPDGETWSELGSGAAPGFVGGVEIELSAGTDGDNVLDPGAAHFDDVNGGAPPCP